MTKESFPDLIVRCLEIVCIPAGYIMVTICIYVTLADGFFLDKFTPGFMAIGIVLLALIIAPTVLFYLRYIEEGETKDPFVLDLKANNALTLRLAEDTQYANVMRELDDSSPQNKNSPPY